MLAVIGWKGSMMRDERTPDLFTKRLRKPKPALEIAVHCAIADTLRLSLKKDWVWFHPPNGGFRTKAEAGKFKRMGVLEGASDFILISPVLGRVHALELKARGQKPSEPQLAFLEAVRAAGGRAEWVDSYERALDVLLMWEALRTKIAVQ